MQTSYLICILLNYQLDYVKFGFSPRLQPPPLPPPPPLGLTFFFNRSIFRELLPVRPGPRRKTFGDWRSRFFRRRDALPAIQPTASKRRSVTGWKIVAVPMAVTINRAWNGQDAWNYVAPERGDPDGPAVRMTTGFGRRRTIGGVAAASSKRLASPRDAADTTASNSEKNADTPPRRTLRMHHVIWLTAFQQCNVAAPVA